jgi:hypothetical protein
MSGPSSSLPLFDVSWIMCTDTHVTLEILKYTSVLVQFKLDGFCTSRLPETLLLGDAVRHGQNIET